ncbi:exocyst complex component EXO70A1-like [Cornus florida]|uniref:exocyst complex component EXO70A1-like n=1 Tax=Cornus florida TaxID=4283 RepID=UPI002896FD2C|nr:exocyst complex component EXO70A1-like [Cornus florida]
MVVINLGFLELSKSLNSQYFDINKKSRIETLFDMMLEKLKYRIPCKSCVSSWSGPRRESPQLDKFYTLMNYNMMSESSIEAAFESGVKLILLWDATVGGPMIFHGDHNLINQYLQAVDDIHRWMEITTVSDDQSKGQKAIELAMAQLKEEFANIFTGQTCCPSYSTCSSSMSDSTCFELDEEDYLDYHAPSEEEINNLRAIAERMNSVGYLRQCVQCYKRVRKALLEDRIQRLGVEKLSSRGVQRLVWAVLEAKIRQWIRGAIVCVRVLFSIEKQLCEQIFGGFGDNVADFCLLETIRDAAIQLFDFVEAISTTRRSPERLFKFLDVYKVFMIDLLPHLKVLFQLKSEEPDHIQALKVPIRIRTNEAIHQLLVAIDAILPQLEKSLLRDVSSGLVPGGSHHNLTRHIMKYITRISDYNQSLTELIIFEPPKYSIYFDDQFGPEMDLLKFEGQTPLVLHLIWIIEILLHNLELKSKDYKDAALGYLFKMNNIHHIVQEIEGCPGLKMMIPDDYLYILTEEVQQSANSYRAATCSNILHCLRHEGLEGGNWSFLVSDTSDVSKSALKARFKTFNSMFEEIHRTQSTWSVPDRRLQAQVHKSLLEKLIPAYRSFLGVFRIHVEMGKQPEKYIKYSVEDLETAVLDFFEKEGNFRHKLISLKGLAATRVKKNDKKVSEERDSVSTSIAAELGPNCPHTPLATLLPPKDSSFFDYQFVSDMDFLEFERQTPLVLHFSWIIMILLYQLEVESMDYKDAALAHLRMNQRKA